ncbi:hypothetical protein F5Y16DRAFT_252082 [Xylariaceae sp. FL0255]|nr:hypothetical protein F5Y16DRAFT_252082 [Xylariaceae sp. FL0255]
MDLTLDAERKLVHQRPATTTYLPSCVVLVVGSVCVGGQLGRFAPGVVCPGESVCRRIRLYHKSLCLFSSLTLHLSVSIISACSRDLLLVPAVRPTEDGDGMACSLPGLLLFSRPTTSIRHGCLVCLFVSTRICFDNAYGFDLTLNLSGLLFMSEGSLFLSGELVCYVTTQGVELGSIFGGDVEGVICR